MGQLYSFLSDFSEVCNESWHCVLALENHRTAKEVFFYICFFVNNQFRIIVEGSAMGSDNLEEVFEKNLRRIGRVVAVLDTWQQPVYLQRVWTIYEQYVACSLQVPVTFVMPEHASASCLQRSFCMSLTFIFFQASAVVARSSRPLARGNKGYALED